MAKSEHSSEQQLHHAGKDNEVLNVVKVISNSLQSKFKTKNGAHEEAVVTKFLL